MNQLTESTKSTYHSIKAHALIAKALSNDSKPTPGYLFPEIARFTQSPATCSVVLTQLLKVITPSGYPAAASSNNGSGAVGFTGTATTYSSSPQVLLKALKILRQLSQSGSIEFRTQLARRGKSLLIEMVNYKGAWDEIHGDRMNEDVRAVAEDLIEYMHANPVQEQEDLEVGKSLNDREAAVLKNSTQDLQGFGNPEYDDSASDDDSSQRSGRKDKKRPSNKPTPPLPGFGNPAFERDNSSTESTLMARLVDRLQEMTAPPPPLAMQEAFRQQEQRRQKLFVGEYSMRGDTSGTYSNTKDRAISLMGTNPFKRTTRAQGKTAGGWTDNDMSDQVTNRVYPLSRLGPGTLQFRNSTSTAVYALAQGVQTDLVRTKLPRPAKDTAGSEDLLEIANRPVVQESNDVGLISIWGTAKEICDVVLQGVKNEAPVTDTLDQGDDKLTSAGRSVSVLTGLLRDMMDWIEQEDWERRLIAY
ncbi:AP-4 complex accessory subunit Tepsin [Haplosporangium sp. Z 11]|nr:AP-4 complex accessory subunit Tepsin [Haplosporangium sp. Z 11]